MVMTTTATTTTVMMATMTVMMANLESQLSNPTSLLVIRRFSVRSTALLVLVVSLPEYLSPRFVLVDPCRLGMS